MLKTFELGVSTLLWYDEPDLLTHLPAAAAAGVRHIELRRLQPHVDIGSPTSVRRLTKALRENGVGVHSVHLPTDAILGMSASAPGPRDHAVREAARVAEACVALGAGTLVAHAGGPIPEGQARADVAAASVASLTELSAACDRLGLRLAVENTLPTTPRVGDTVAELVRIVDRLPGDHVGYCLDTSHANLDGDVGDAVATVGSRLFTLHVSDNDRVSDQHALPFEGTVDWRGFMGALRAVGYAGVFMLEVRGGTDPRRTLRAAVERFERLCDGS